MSLFKIRREVMQALDAHARVMFTERMFLVMYEEHADTCAAIGEERVKDEIERGIQKTIGYGIFDEADVETFLHMMFELGFDFDVHTPKAKRILNHKKMAGAAKIGILAELLD